MNIIIVGGTGTIGKAVAKELGLRHHIIIAAYNHGDIQVDITDPLSIENMYKSVGEFHALISTTGKVNFVDFGNISVADYHLGLNDKLMGQVNLVLLGRQYIQGSGSFTLTSGRLSFDPIRCGSSASMVNGAINSFVISSAIEMPKKIRINVVSPTILTESIHTYEQYFHGFETVSAERVALAYSKSVEGLQSGQIYQVG